MSLRDYEFEMDFCSRCSHCKWIPLLFIKSHRYANVCPAIERFNFHAYSGSGRVIAAHSVHEGRSEITDELLDVIYRCQLDGACNVMCHLSNEILEPLQIIRELRTLAVERGMLLPEHTMIIDSMRKEDNVLGEKKADRGKWAEGLDVKDINSGEAEVFYHAGCRYSYNQDLRGIARTGISLLRGAGVDVGIAGGEEACCGGRAFDIGYRGEMEKYADDFANRLRSSGASTLVTSCSDCYSAFKHLYPMIGKKLDVEIVHITEYLDRLIKEGRIALCKEVPLRVTYHDPCHLGRLGEEYTPWSGEWKTVHGGVIVSDPPKPVHKGLGGVYDPPRDVLKAIPGLQLLEMERNREFSWCCGAGGGVLEAYEDFAAWTAMERIEEARSTGAEALVTACPWCERNFKDAVAANGHGITVYDVVELVQEAAG
ncbi:MAG: (Fe-S)-binding protein [Actinobacteria bacterium]|nr:MAG: (Fe-S)-binding protein [Actinomycetota bacterium]